MSLILGGCLWNIRSSTKHRICSPLEYSDPMNKSGQTSAAVKCFNLCCEHEVCPNQQLQFSPDISNGSSSCRVFKCKTFSAATHQSHADKQSISLAISQHYELPVPGLSCAGTNRSFKLSVYPLSRLLTTSFHSDHFTFPTTYLSTFPDVSHASDWFFFTSLTNTVLHWFV